MPDKTREVDKLFCTDFTNVGPLSSVNSAVYHQVHLSHETFSTFCTSVRLGHAVNLCVVSRQTFLGFGIDIALVAHSFWLPFSSSSFKITSVLVHVVISVESLSTVIAQLWSRSVVYVCIVSSKGFFFTTLEITIFTFIDSCGDVTV